jgi:hypothetical protein
MRRFRLLLLLVSCSAGGVSVAAPLGSAFIFQGRLTDGGTAANGTYDLRFILYNAEVGGSQAGGTLTNESVTAINGLFSTSLDFGPGVFDGTAYWLEIAVRPGASTGAFTLLDPRQPVTPAPSALYASSAGLALSMPWSALTGIPAAFADGLDNDTTYSAGAGLSLSGTQFSVNFAGSGAADSAARSDHIHDAAAIVSGTLADARLSANVALLNSSPTFSGNVTSLQDLVGARLRVGSGQFLTGNAASISGGLNSTNEADFASIAGGGFNRIMTSSAAALIGGGWANTVATNARYSVVGGGRSNLITASSWHATIAGGWENSAGSNGTIGGGTRNQATNDSSTVGGGYDNQSGGAAAVIGGGQANRASGLFATVAGGWINVAAGYASAIAGGNNNQTTNNFTTVSGGSENRATANWASVGGGLNNAATSAGSAIGGGEQNAAPGALGTVGGGLSNSVAGPYGTVPGGLNNSAAALYSFASGQRAKALHQGAYVWADSTAADFSSTAINQFSIRAMGGVRFETGGSDMSVDGERVLHGQVVTAELADGSVVTPKLADGAVTTAKLADGAVTSPKLAPQLSLGPAAAAGSLSLYDAQNGPRTLLLDGDNGQFASYDTNGHVRSILGGTRFGELHLLDPDDSLVASASLEAGNNTGGQLTLRDGNSLVRVLLEGRGTLGGGELELRGTNSSRRVELFGNAPTLTNPNTGTGGGGADFYAADNTRTVAARGEGGTIDVLGGFGVLDSFGGITLGSFSATGFGGQLRLRGTNNLTTALLASSSPGGYLELFQGDGELGVWADGDNGGAGAITVYQADGDSGVFIDGDSGGAGLIQVKGDTGANRVVLDGKGGGAGGGEISVVHTNGVETVEILGAGDATTGGRITVKAPDGSMGAILQANESIPLAFNPTSSLHLFNSDSDIGVYLRAGPSFGGRIGIDRSPLEHALEVEGAASKTTAGDWLANSDRRIKTDVRTITNALETIARVRPVTFRYTEEYRKAHRKIRDIEYYNVIAQEFAEVFPDSVSESGDTLPNGEKILQVDTYPATIHAIAAIKELHELIKEKDQRISSLESRNRSLEARLERIERLLESQREIGDSTNTR